jgi:hypothetical protein
MFRATEALGMVAVIVPLPLPDEGVRIMSVASDFTLQEPFVVSSNVTSPPDRVTACRVGVTEITAGDMSLRGCSFVQPMLNKAPIAKINAKNLFAFIILRGFIE